MKGHGSRTRMLVEAGQEKQCWVRRYLCNACSGTVLVTPEGVLQGCLYTLKAIIMAWLAILAEPLGEGLSEDEAGDAHARSPLAVELNRSGGSRWRSLSRWADRIEDWWPGRAVAGTTWRERVSSLISGFLPGGGGQEGILTRAWNAHLAGGATM